MSTVINPPIAPPQTGGGGGPGPSSVLVTRNVPPKRVQVLPGNQISYGGRTYTSDDGSFLMGDGPVADQMALMGHLVIVSHEEVDAWNGDEGETIRTAALKGIDAHHKATGTTRTHDHGFIKYEHADPNSPMPVDLTSHRTQLAQQHLLTGTTMTDEEGQGKKRDAK